MRTFWYAGLLLLTGMVLFACQSGDLLVGQSIINPQELVIQSVDTMTIKTSTVMRPDSFVTSGDVNLLVGRWSDSQTGTMTARCFAAVNYANNSFSTQTNLRLDSLVLELNYAFVQGDSSSLFDLSVHKLSKELLIQAYYNTNSVGYDPTPYLRRSVQPQPKSRNKQIQFRIPDDLAQSFFDKLSSGQITGTTTLSEFLPGFAFNCNSTANTFVGFTAATSGLRLYYHTTDLDRTSSSLLFPFSSIYFTQLVNDRTGTVLSGLKNRSDAINSRSTNNTSFVVPGAQLYTRIEFPYLNDFIRPEQYADLNKAILVIRPVRSSLNDNAAPPTQLALYFTNNQNDILSIAVPAGIAGTTSPLTTYTYDPTALILEDAYKFDLTYYIGQVIKRKALIQPLLLGAPTGSYTLKDWVQRVTIGNQQNANDKLQLQLFMTSGS
ncbi:DUF4270 family protein [Spirosoma gilvum]